MKTVLVQKLAELPKIGDHVPVESFHVSKTNVRCEEPFGETEEDKKLIAHFKAGKKVVQPFKARPEEGKYGVYVGRRRFLAQKEAGAKFFVVGEDCLIMDITEEEAEESSWIENFSEFHKEMNPITRAKGLNKFVSRWGLREYSRRSGIPASTISEYLKILELSPKIQGALVKESITFRDGLKIARMNLDIKAQDKLAEIVETRGIAPFKKEINSTKHVSAKKLAEGDLAQGKAYWAKLTESLREFTDIFSDYCTIEEWEDDHAYHLTLKATMQKNGEESYDSNGLETLPEDEAPQVCGSCGKDIVEGDPFIEDEGIYYCQRCAKKADLEN